MEDFFCVVPWRKVDCVRLCIPESFACCIVVDGLVLGSGMWRRCAILLCRSHRYNSSSNLQSVWWCWNTGLYCLGRSWLPFDFAVAGCYCILGSCHVQCWVGEQCVVRCVDYRGLFQRCVEVRFCRRSFVWLVAHVVVTVCMQGRWVAYVAVAPSVLGGGMPACCTWA